MAALHPSSEDQVGIADGVIGVQVGDENGLEIRGSQGFYAVVVGLLGAADDSGAGVDKIGGSLDDDGGGGAGALRVGARGSGAEEDDLGLGEQGAADEETATDPGEQHSSIQ